MGLGAFSWLSDPSYWRPRTSLSCNGPGPRTVLFGRPSASLPIEPISAAKQERWFGVAPVALSDASQGQTEEFR